MHYPMVIIEQGVYFHMLFCTVILLILEPNKRIEYSALFFDGPQDISGISWLTTTDGVASNMTGASLIHSLDQVISNFHKPMQSEAGDSPFIIDSLLEAIKHHTPQLAAHTALLLYTCGR